MCSLERTNRVFSNQKQSSEYARKILKGKMEYVIKCVIFVVRGYFLFIFRIC